uniref:Uncharacterized protein n=1 Tax=Rhizophora mucronata TaxID=61149 RepID=A0A2P2R0G1_RHIMU
MKGESRMGLPGKT